MLRRGEALLTDAMMEISSSSEEGVVDEGVTPVQCARNERNRNDAPCGSKGMHHSDNFSSLPQSPRHRRRQRPCTSSSAFSFHSTSNMDYTRMGMPRTAGYHTRRLVDGNTDDASRDPAPLSWRLHPDESLSDWTLTVASTDSTVIKNRGSSREHSDRPDLKTQAEVESRGENIDVERMSSLQEESLSPPAIKYHVHKTQLAVGRRQSDYFATLFKKRRQLIRSGQIEGADCNHTDGTYIEVKASAAAAFPVMLDFIYSPAGTPINATTESAVALRHLASCFGVREMFNSVTEFIKKDIRPETAPQYANEAAIYKHDKLLAASIKVCAQHFDTIKLSRIVMLAPHLMEMVVRSPHLVCDSEVLSSKVASYCRCRPGGVDLDTLLSLTDAEKMPKVSPEESLFFVHLLSLHGVELPDHASSKSAPFTLYERCVAASPNVVMAALEVKNSPFSPGSSYFHDNQRRNMKKDYQDLPCNVKVELLESTVADFVSTSEGADSIGSCDDGDLRPSYIKLEGAYDEAQKDILVLREEIGKLRIRYEEKIAAYKRKLGASVDEVNRCKNELKRFGF